MSLELLLEFAEESGVVLLVLFSSSFYLASNGYTICMNDQMEFHCRVQCHTMQLGKITIS